MMEMLAISKKIFVGYTSHLVGGGGCRGGTDAPVWGFRITSFPIQFVPLSFYSRLLL